MTSRYLYPIIIAGLMALCCWLYVSKAEAEERDWQSIMAAVQWQTKANALESSLSKRRR